MSSGRPPHWNHAKYFTGNDLKRDYSTDMLHFLACGLPPEQAEIAAHEVQIIAQYGLTNARVAVSSGGRVFRAGYGIVTRRDTVLYDKDGLKNVDLRAFFASLT